MSPEVQQKATPPPGHIPRGRQAYVMIGVAVVIVLAVVFTGSTTPAPKASTGSQLPVNTPSKAEIDRYTQTLQIEEARLRRAQEEANRSRAAMSQAASEAGIHTGVQGGIPGQGIAGPNGQTYYPAQNYQPATPLEKSPIQDDKEKREYASLFASNVALSFRKEPVDAPKPQQVEPLTKVPEPSAPPAPTPAIPAGHTLFEGTVLEAVLANRLEGSFSGPVNCQITANVYSRDHQHLLIPQGSRVLGEARRVDQQDQQRMAIVFHRLIMPDGYSVTLDRVQGLDQAGATGLKDRVNNHYLSVFGTSIALGVLSGFSLYGTGGVFTGSGVDAYRQGVSSELGRDATRILDRQLNRLPTLTVREGVRVKIYLNADLSLPAYAAHPGL